MKTILFGLAIGATIITPAAAQVAPDQKFMIELQAKELDIVGMALQRAPMPMIETLPIINKLNDQVRQQTQPPTPEKPAEKKPTPNK